MTKIQLLELRNHFNSINTTTKYQYNNSNYSTQIRPVIERNKVTNHLIMYGVGSISICIAPIISLSLSLEEDTFMSYIDEVSSLDFNPESLNYSTEYYELSWTPGKHQGGYFNITVNTESEVKVLVTKNLLKSCIYTLLTIGKYIDIDSITQAIYDKFNNFKDQMESLSDWTPLLDYLDDDLIWEPYYGSESNHITDILRYQSSLIKDIISIKLTGSEFDENSNYNDDPFKDYIRYQLGTLSNCDLSFNRDFGIKTKLKKLMVYCKDLNHDTLLWYLIDYINSMIKDFESEKSDADPSSTSTWDCMNILMIYNNYVSDLDKVRMTIYTKLSEDDDKLLQRNGLFYGLEKFLDIDPMDTNALKSQLINSSDFVRDRLNLIPEDCLYPNVFCLGIKLISSFKFDPNFLNEPVPTELTDLTGTKLFTYLYRKFY